MDFQTVLVSKFYMVEFCFTISHLFTYKDIYVNISG